jgi:exodeoxyribonuclease V alpha subunit
MTEFLSKLAHCGILQPIDLSFAHMLAGLSPKHPEEIALAGALCSAATRGGQTCLALSALAGSQPKDEQGQPLDDGVFPKIEEWVGALRSTGCVSCGGPPAPLVLDPENRLYLYKMWRAQADVAQGLKELASQPQDDGGPALEEVIDRFVPTNWATPMQREAVRAVATKRLTVITGGPGTGKTTTLVRALLLLLHRDNQRGLRPRRVLLLAPTGKAALRMTQAVDQALGGLARDGFDVALRERLSPRASTVHRTLSEAWSSGLLAADVVAVDEASMLDLALFARLLRAMPRKATLVLIGDAHQLASVEAGSVLCDIARAAEAIGEGADIRSCVVELQQPHRFAGQGGIGALAQAVRMGDSNKAFEVLQAGGQARFHDAQSLGTEGLVVKLLESHLEAYANAQDPIERLERLDKMRVLCAHRRGPASCQSVGRAIEKTLAEKFGMPMPGPWYNGRPVLVRSNDPRLDLSNGEVGVVHTVGQRVSIVFRGHKGARSLAPTQIRDYETTYAMTVHKAQGSEYEEVIVVLPSQASKIVSRELLYTAVTRARIGVHLVSPASVIRAACAARVSRASGLADMLMTPAARRKDLGA